jgi:hypothetical protein
MGTPNFFPRSRGGRFALAVLSFCLLTVSAPFAALFVGSLLAIAFPGNALPINPWVGLLLILLEEAFFAVFVVILLGLIWAIATPVWIERTVEKFAGHAMLAFLVLMIVGTIVSLL